jgi:hypothetical protein
LALGKGGLDFQLSPAVSRLPQTAALFKVGIDSNDDPRKT